MDYESFDFAQDKFMNYGWGMRVAGRGTRGVDPNQLVNKSTNKLIFNHKEHKG